MPPSKQPPMFKPLTKTLRSWSALSAFVGRRLPNMWGGYFQRLGIGDYVLSIQGGSGMYSEPRMTVLPTLAGYKDVEMKLFRRKGSTLTDVSPHSLNARGSALAAHIRATFTVEGRDSFAAYASRESVLRLIALLQSHHGQDLTR